ncbi:MAG: hypothetical protein JWN76_494 [Chitinophagaceae bacterium]|nr:hypothetical protein [Chitinophagaceae bacterium]
MKKRFFLLIVGCVLILWTHSQKLLQRFILAGQMTGQDSGFIRLEYVDIKGRFIKDSAIVHDGKFTFAGQINGPTIADLIGNVTSDYADDNNRVTFFLEPVHMSISMVTNNLKSAHITGSRAQDELRQAELNRKSLLIIMKSIQENVAEVRKAYSEDRTNDSLKNILLRTRDQLGPYVQRLKQADVDFIKSHPKSYVSPYLLSFVVQDMSFDSANAIFHSFSPEIQTSRSGKYIQELLLFKKAGKVGMEAKNFLTKDVEGKTLSLNQFKQKYVLLDFWASWCEPCRKDNPELINIFNTYHSKGLQIIGIASDDSRPEEWKKAINTDHINIWHHVLQGFAGDNHVNDIAYKYGITSFPTKILIDKKGIIIERFDNESLDLFLLKKKLSMLFTK